MDERSVIRKFRITAADGKNYLNKDELDSLDRIVNAYLELAEDRAKPPYNRDVDIPEQYRWHTLKTKKGAGQPNKPRPTNVRASVAD